VTALAAALEYAERGWPVLPCEPRGKRPLGRLVPHGLKQASTDPDVIQFWFAAEPAANLGLATGVAFDALDVDGDAGRVALGEAMPAGAETVDGPTVTTGKGCHVYIAATGLGNRAGVVPGVDFRGQGGYVVGVPSVHPSGAAYLWHLGEDDPDFGARAPLRPPPAWLLALLQKPTAAPVTPGVDLTGSRAGTYGRRALESEVGKVLLAHRGERNDALNKASFALGQLVAGGVLGVDEVADALLLASERVGLEVTEARLTIASGLRSGAAQPRRVPA
jgi:hypothetical protein